MFRFFDVDGQDYSILKDVWLLVYAYFHLVCLVSWIVVASCTLTLLWYHISNSVCPWVSYSWSWYPCVLPKTIRWPKLSHASCDSVLIGRKPSLQILILQILVQSRFDSWGSQMELVLVGNVYYKIRRLDSSHIRLIFKRGKWQQPISIYAE